MSNYTPSDVLLSNISRFYSLAVLPSACLAIRANFGTVSSRLTLQIRIRNAPPFGGEDFQTNLIMPEPCPFLSRKFPVCSIIRPTHTDGAAMGALRALTADGLFIGQSPQFFDLLRDLAEDADEARR